MAVIIFLADYCISQLAGQWMTVAIVVCSLRQIIPEYYQLLLGGLALSNSEYARLGEVIGSHDLGLSICVGAHQVLLLIFFAFI